MTMTTPVPAMPRSTGPSRRDLGQTASRVAPISAHPPLAGSIAHLKPHITPMARLVKRSCDILGASLGLVTLLPVFMLSALAVRLTSQGPALFVQTRVGKGGATFPCLKFRTMRIGAEAQRASLLGANLQDGPAFKVRNDPRVTPVGRFLRKFSLDELPQLLNVLVGDMSLVGPRPPLPSEVASYSEWHMGRTRIRPGLTCVWQVYGRNRVTFQRWVEMDLWYIDNMSLGLDIKLIVHTFRVVLMGTGM